MTNYKPRGDQPRAIEQIIEGLGAGEKHQVLLGVTGSGKTFTMAILYERNDTDLKRGTFRVRGESSLQAVGNSSPGAGGFSGMRSR